MRDRVPSPGKENRVRIRQDNGQVVEGVLEYADDATQEGSRYTKGNVLPDDVCMVMSLDPDPSEPEDAFRYLGLLNAEAYGGIFIKISSRGVPLSGIAFSVTGSGTVKTDENGIAFLKKPPGTYTASFSNTLDLIFSPSSFRVTSKAGIINYYDVEAQESPTTEKIFTTSTTVTFSDRVSEFDVFCVGAGGSGGVACALLGLFSVAVGGAGGFTNYANGIKNDGSIITISIGSGGPSAVLSISSITYDAIQKTGNDGGDTSVSIGGSVVCTAKGGSRGNATSNDVLHAGKDGSSGGSGSGSGERYEAGSAGSNGSSGGSTGMFSGGTGQGKTTRPFGGSTGTSYSPAGETVWANSDEYTDEVTHGSGGTAPGGGISGFSETSTSSGSATASQGSTPGSGGGGTILASTYSGNPSRSYSVQSGAGSNGLVIIRWRYK